MVKRAVIDTGDTMVAIIVDILEHDDPAASGELKVGSRVRVTRGLYAGIVGEVRMIISADDGSNRSSGEHLPRRGAA